MLPGRKLNPCSSCQHNEKTAAHKLLCRLSRPCSISLRLSTFLPWFADFCPTNSSLLGLPQPQTHLIPAAIISLSLVFMFTVFHNHIQPTKRSAGPTVAGALQTLTVVRAKFFPLMIMLGLPRNMLFSVIFLKINWVRELVTDTAAVEIKILSIFILQKQQPGCTPASCWFCLLALRNPEFTVFSNQEVFFSWVIFLSVEIRFK